MVWVGDDPGYPVRGHSELSGMPSGGLLYLTRGLKVERLRWANQVTRFYHRVLLNIDPGLPRISIAT